MIDKDKKLKELLEKKAKEKFNLVDNKFLNLLNKSKFYYSSNNQLLEHIATYKNYCILLKSSNLKKDIDKNNTEMFPTLVKTDEIKGLKRVNGNIVRKLKPDTLSNLEKLALINSVVGKIDEDFS